MRNAFYLGCALLLSGCATTYQPSGFSGGFAETRLSENIFRVRFNGNGYTSAERVSDMAMLRSAQLTKQNGYSFFALADERNSTAHSSFTTPTQSSTTAQATVFGNTAYGTAQTITTGGQTFNISKAKTENLVVMFRERPAGGGIVYEASFICDSLGPRFKTIC